MTRARRGPGWTVYVLRRADGALYTGITTDLARRLAQHAGERARGARALRGRGPLEVVYQADVGDRPTALRVEARLKRLGKRDKERLVADRPRPSALRRRLGIE